MFSELSTAAANIWETPPPLLYKIPPGRGKEETSELTSGNLTDLENSEVTEKTPVD